MSIPSEEERKHWWLMVYAHTSFEKSLHACNLLLELVESTMDDLYLPIAVSVHAMYGRPFKKQFGVGRLPDDYIPTEWRGIHQALITIRDQMLVHTDATPVQQAGRPLHDVVYHRIGSESIFSTSDPRPRLDHYSKVSRYLPRLIKRVRDDIDSIHARYSHLLPTIGGHYVLNLTGEALFTEYESPDPHLRF